MQKAQIILPNPRPKSNSPRLPDTGKVMVFYLGVFGPAVRQYGPPVHEARHVFSSRRRLASAERHSGLSVPESVGKCGVAGYSYGSSARSAGKKATTVFCSTTRQHGFTHMHCGTGERGLLRPLAWRLGGMTFAHAY